MATSSPNWSRSCRGSGAPDRTASGAVGGHRSQPHIVLRPYDDSMVVMQSSEGVVMAVETGPVALVTGASAGIGEAAARALLGRGFTFYGTSRKAAAGETRDGVVLLPLDVTDDASVA